MTKIVAEKFCLISCFFEVEQKLIPLVLANDYCLGDVDDGGVSSGGCLAKCISWLLELELEGELQCTLGL